MQTEAKVAAVYAETLLELSREEGVVPSVCEQFKECVSAFQKEKNVWKFLTSPVASNKAQMDLLTATLKGKLEANLEKLLLHFFFLLLKRKRFSDLPLIQTLFQSQAHHFLSLQSVGIRSAKELSKAEEEQLSIVLKKYFDKDIVMEREVCPDLIGGLVIRSGGLLIDASIQTRLRTIQDKFLNQDVLGEEYYEN